MKASCRRPAPSYSSAARDRGRRQCAGRLLLWPEAALWADCTIRNLSAAARRSNCPEVHVAPPRFVLLHFEADVAYDAVLKWRAATWPAWPSRADAAGRLHDPRWPASATCGWRCAPASAPD
jgi:hypothetical protein